VPKHCILYPVLQTPILPLFSVFELVYFSAAIAGHKIFIIGHSKENLWRLKQNSDRMNNYPVTKQS